MEVIKERVAQVLDRKGVLTKLKAELRANVFLAINEQDIKDGGVGLSSKSDRLRREELLAYPAGVLVVELVREFMRWCNLQFTLQVFDPEMQLPSAALDRSNLAQQLGLDGSGPLLLQLLNQHLQGATQPGRLSTLAAAQEALAAPAEAPAVAVLPTGHGTASSALAYNMQPQQQQQHTTLVAGAVQPTAVLSKAALGPADVAAVKQASKSTSIVEDIDLDKELINAQLAHEDSNEEYAAVFLAAQGHSASSAHGSEDSSSNAMPQQQQPRPVRGVQGMTSETFHQASLTAAAARDLSGSFGSLDRSPATLGLDLHGLESLPQALHTVPNHPPAAAEGGVVAITDTAAGPGAFDNLTGAGSFISPASSCTDLHPQQHMVPALTAAAMPGRLAPLEPLGPLRPNKLAPLGPVKGPGLVGVSSSSNAPAKASGSEELKDELRRAGLIGSTTSSPAASSSTSPQGQAAQHALHYGHELDSPGSPGSAAAAAVGGVQQTAGSDLNGTSQGQVSGALPAAEGVVYGSAVVDDDSSDEDSDDFGLSARELFAAARRQLSQSGRSEQQQLQEHQQPAVQGSAAAGARWDQGGSVGDSDDIIDDIPEDFSGNLPIEDLEDGDLNAVYPTGATPVTGINATVAAAAGAADQLGMSMDLHETGMSLSEKLAGIAGLTSADLLDEDDF